jgi:DNA-binding XRE family transcriptional regulator
MLPLFDINQLNSFKREYLLPFECVKCGQTFYIEAKWVKNSIKLHPNKHQFCSNKCKIEARKTSTIGSCSQCGKIISIKSSDKSRSKSGNNFCSKHCSVTYNNTHKTTGNRRSKLEIWLEEQLTKQHPDLEIKYNDKTIINSELDIYIPSLKLAFELNGIFHYEPIFGPEKLSYIQNNDQRKFQACLEKQIELVIIDSSKMINFKPLKAQKYLDIILDILNKCIK